MKKLIVLSVLAALAAAPEGFAETESLKLEMSKRRAEWRKLHPPKPTGGLLERKPVIPSATVSVRNLQSAVPADEVQDIVSQLRIASNLPIELDSKGRVGMTLELVSEPGQGAVAVFPEEMTARVNVAKLASDNPSAEILKSRLSKEIIRATLFTLGSGYTQMPCFATPVFSLKELDQLNVRRVSPDSATHLIAANRVGIQRVGFATYRQACQEGWAPSPTNDIQKAIWEEVHASPKNPMKIEFDPKKGR